VSNGHHARTALEGLLSRFEAASRAYPRLRHVLIETPTAQALEEARRKLDFAFPPPVYPYDKSQAWEIAVERIPSGTSEIQVFVEEDCYNGRKALDALEWLARDAVEILTAYKLAASEMLPPAPDRGSYGAARRWMVLVHRVARNRRPGDLLRSESERLLMGHLLPDQTLVWTLLPGAFLASALAIERILTEGMEQAGPAAPPRGNEQGGEIASGTPAQPAATKPKPTRKPKRTRNPRPVRPKTLRELAAEIRRDHPRQRNVPGFLELIEEKSEVDFDEIADKVHGARVDDDAIEKTVIGARKAIVKARLRFAIHISGRQVLKKSISG
jgi:hypothetical protein